MRFSRYMKILGLADWEQCKSIADDFINRLDLSDIDPDLSYSAIELLQLPASSVNLLIDPPYSCSCGNDM
ncbi:MAG: hypothetical protein OXF08_00820 [Bacteroidetes bacterium]|nr:hypothetical protein [Bacteroidota bacterium]